MNYDDILEDLGELGPWQMLHLSLLWFPSAANGLWTLVHFFSGKKLRDYTKKIP